MQTITNLNGSGGLISSRACDIRRRRTVHYLAIRVARHGDEKFCLLLAALNLRLPRETETQYGITLWGKTLSGIFENELPTAVRQFHKSTRTGIEEAKRWCITAEFRTGSNMVNLPR